MIQFFFNCVAIRFQLVVVVVSIFFLIVFQFYFKSCLMLAHLLFKYCSIRFQFGFPRGVNSVSIMLRAVILFQVLLYSVLAMCSSNSTHYSALFNGLPHGKGG